MKFILGKKIAMSQIFNEKGRVIPVTLIEAGPCFVTQLKIKEKDGYRAYQIGFEKIEKPSLTKVTASKEKKIKKSQRKKPYRWLKEFRDRKQETKNKEQRTENREDKIKVGDSKVGDRIDVSIFKEGDLVKISGISKGKGFAGVVKRWGFRGLSATHGTKHEERAPGSIGSRWPQRVVKGRKMPGRMGGERITVKNLKVVKVDVENNLLAVKGAVPGRRGTLLEIRG